MTSASISIASVGSTNPKSPLTFRGRSNGVDVSTHVNGLGRDDNINTIPSRDHFVNLIAVMESYPPLLGDKDGQYRIHVVGNSGAGKSTVALALAKTLGVPYLPLDTLFWQPGWKLQTPAGELKEKLRAQLEIHKDGWVIDGNHEMTLAPIIQAAATDILWLDPPFILYFPRLIYRTLWRILQIDPPCSPGCQETVSGSLFTTNSLFLWCISTHGVIRRVNGEKMKRIGLGVGSDVEGRKMRRIGGWGGELKIWMRDVVDMVNGKGKVE